MKRHIVCFGDSNTFGYCADPKDCADSGGRFNKVYCQQAGVHHLDAQELNCEFNQIDYMHLAKKGPCHTGFASYCTCSPAS